MTVWVLLRRTDVRVSTRRNKKYMASVDGHWIHFGDRRYQQYRDQTDVRFFSKLDHNDRHRRRNYFLRHSKEESKIRAIEKEFELSGRRLTAKILSHYFLW